jgi:mannose-6-phosphate isomerase-like protein (cupin superfamily)
MTHPAPRYQLLQLDQVAPTQCPCGSSQRAFVDDPDRVASLHLVETDGTARTHYHRRTTELYYFLEGSGQIELDGESFPVGPGTSVLIKPECRHRAIGKLRYLNVPIPAHDPNDEWFDD